MSRRQFLGCLRMPWEVRLGTRRAHGDFLPAICFAPLRTTPHNRGSTRITAISLSGGPKRRYGEAF